MIGKRYGRLVVLDLAGRDRKSNLFVRVRCDCGTTKVIRKGQLDSGNTKSCGCLRRELTAANTINRARLRVPSAYPVQLVEVPLVRKGPIAAPPPPRVATGSPLDRAVDFMHQHGATARKAAARFGLEPQVAIDHYNERFGTRRVLVG